MQEQEIAGLDVTPIVLFTEEELVHSFDHKETLKKTSSISSQAKGPNIELVSPTLSKGVVEVLSTEKISIKINFNESPSGRKPNMKSLFVVVGKGIFSKNITKKFASYIHGTSIWMPVVDLSGYSGRYVFQISIKDESGNKSQAQFLVNVV